MSAGWTPTISRGPPPPWQTFRWLLARQMRPNETDLRAYGDAVVHDPSSWGLYTFSVPTEGYVTDRIPEELHDSPNLRPERALGPALERLRLSLKAQKGAEAALAFVEAQGPRTRQLLDDEMAPRLPDN